MADKKQNRRNNRNNQDDDFNPKFRKIRKKVCPLCGDKNFVLIEEVANVSEEFEIIPVYGDPLMLSNTIGALSTNSLSWSHNNIDYYLASNDLSTSEILSIADSLSVANVVEEK